MKKSIEELFKKTYTEVLSGLENSMWVTINSGPPKNIKKRAVKRYALAYIIKHTNTANKATVKDIQAFLDSVTSDNIEDKLGVPADSDTDTYLELKTQLCTEHSPIYSLVGTLHTDLSGLIGREDKNSKRYYYLRSEVIKAFNEKFKDKGEGYGDLKKILLSLLR